LTTPRGLTLSRWPNTKPLDQLEERLLSATKLFRKIDNRYAISHRPSPKRPPNTGVKLQGSALLSTVGIKPCARGGTLSCAFGYRREPCQLQ
jgi:hypothetical protein